MPKDYDPNAGSVSGLTPGKGKGRIAGGPEGTHTVFPPSGDVTKSGSGTGAPGSGTIRGNPIGIVGQVRSMTGDGMKDAIRRKLGR